MLATFQILVLTTFLASLVYWVLPKGWVEGRRAVLLVVSGAVYKDFLPFINVAFVVLLVAVPGMATYLPSILF